MCIRDRYRVWTTWTLWPLRVGDQFITVAERYLSKRSMQKRQSYAERKRCRITLKRSCGVFVQAVEGAELPKAVAEIHCVKLRIRIFWLLPFQPGFEWSKYKDFALSHFGKPSVTQSYFMLRFGNVVGLESVPGTAAQTLFIYRHLACI